VSKGGAFMRASYLHADARQDLDTHSFNSNATAHWISVVMASQTEGTNAQEASSQLREEPMYAGFSRFEIELEVCLLRP
jgi:hypothetical protein